MDDLVFKVSEQIKTIRKGNNHVVIIGAGASKASCINKAEINGNQIPLMIDLVKVINLSDLLKDLPDNVRNKNFENVFSKLYEKEPNSNRLQMIEKKIYDYFSALKLPEVPTIYDYLVLSLRDKDLIATFNWDPLLWQAYESRLQS